MHPLETLGCSPGVGWGQKALRTRGKRAADVLPFSASAFPESRSAPTEDAIRPVPVCPGLLRPWPQPTTFP